MWTATPLIQRMPDGTLKHVNPFTGTEVWTVPSRAYRPFPRQPSAPASSRDIRRVERECDFCRGNYWKTPPEKARVVRLPSGAYRILERLNPLAIGGSTAAFRRVANLFEIVTYDYWVENHGFRLSTHQRAWMREYLSENKGLLHIRDLVGGKLRLSGKDPGRSPRAVKRRMTEAFFGGAHDLVIAGPHHRAGGGLYSSGTMTPVDHVVFVFFTIEAMKDIYAQNPHVRFVTVFQNWLRPAGASFEHLHKQLVGLDEWGVSIERETEMVRRRPNVYNDLILNPGWREGLVVAENEGAVMLSECGHRFPTLGIYSKSRRARPEEHADHELRGVSDLVHACHAAMGPAVPCNEEWYFSPRDARHAMPWHILVKWRTVNQAGFEGNTKININPVSPWDLKMDMVLRLRKARAQGRTAAGLRVGGECRSRRNVLLYNR